MTAPCDRCGRSEVEHDGSWAFGHPFAATVRPPGDGLCRAAPKSPYADGVLACGMYAGHPTGEMDDGHHFVRVELLPTVRPPGDEAGLRAALDGLPRYSVAPGRKMDRVPDGHWLWYDDVRAALAAKPDQEEPGLDAAWAAAEAALPEATAQQKRGVHNLGGQIGLNRRVMPRTSNDRYRAVAYSRGSSPLGAATGPTPAAALHALAARLANPDTGS